jgi:hypothetical protein
MSSFVISIEVEMYTCFTTKQFKHDSQKTLFLKVNYVFEIRCAERK